MKLQVASTALLFLLWSTDRVLSQDICDPEDLGSIRLSAGPSESKNEGAVQMCFTDTELFNWEYITTDGWMDIDASVACRKLGLHHTEAIATNLTLSSQAFVVAGIICSCINGEIRLVDGANHREGRVEVCVDGRWGTVCGEDWTEEEARLVCGRLGLPTINATVQPFGGGTGPIFNCAFMGSCTPSNCNHSDDAGVRCLGFDEACAVTVEEQSTTTQGTSSTTEPANSTNAEEEQSTTTQGTSSTTEPANRTSTPQSAIANVNTALAVLTALLAAALLAVIIGWIVTCVYWKCSQSKSMDSGPISTTNEAYGITTTKQDADITTNEPYGTQTVPTDPTSSVYYSVIPA